MEHVPVLLNEVLEALSGAVNSPKVYFDGTFGRGGHTRAVLERFPEIKAVAFDWDEAAIEHAKVNFAAELSGGRLQIYRNNYSEFGQVREERRSEGFPQEFDLMLLDLGVSSPQLDQAERGFSFYHEGPLDMRMDQRRETTAADIVNTWDEDDLIDIFKNLGEVHKPFRVVRAIVHDRKTEPFTTTRQLASMIERVEGWRRKGFHPASLYFMALRLAVNSELDGIEKSVPELIGALAPGGRLAIITFHSLEDRIVKNIFKAHLHCGRLVNKKVIIAGDEENKRNPRARSAKLRVFEKGSES